MCTVTVTALYRDGKNIGYIFLAILEKKLRSSSQRCGLFQALRLFALPVVSRFRSQLLLVSQDAMCLCACPPAIFSAINCSEATIRTAFAESVKARLDIEGVDHLKVGRAGCAYHFACVYEIMRFHECIVSHGQRGRK